MTSKKLTVDEEDAILTQAEEIRAARAAAAKAEAEATFAPLLAFRASAAFEEVAAKLDELAPAFAGQPAVAQNLATTRRLMDALDRVIPPDARPAARA